MADSRTTYEIRLDNEQLLRGIKEAENAFRSLRDAANKNGDLKFGSNFKNQLEKIGGSFSDVGKKASTFWAMAGGAALGGLATGLLQGLSDKIMDVGKSAIQGAADYETMITAFTTALGSTKAATTELENLRAIAAKTPFSFEELSKSMLSMINRGFKPTEAQITSLGDLAASQAKSFDQLVEALLDAQTGEFERLKEFGVKAKTVGDNVEFTFRGQTKTVAKTSDAIKDYVLSLGTVEGVAGGMEAQTQTLNGMISNLKDNFSTVAVEVGQKFLPILKEIATNISNFLGSLDIDTIMAFFAPIKENLLPALKEVWDAVMSVIGAVLGFDPSKPANSTKIFAEIFNLLVDALTLAAKGVSTFVEAIGYIIKSPIVQGALSVLKGIVDVVREIYGYFSSKVSATGMSSEDVQKLTLAKSNLQKSSNDLTKTAQDALAASMEKLSKKTKDATKETNSNADAAKKNAEAAKKRKEAVEALSKAYDTLAEKVEKEKAGNLTGADKINAEATIALKEIDDLQRQLTEQAAKAGKTLTQTALDNIEALRDLVAQERLVALKKLLIEQRKALKESEDAMIADLTAADKKEAEKKAEARKKQLEDKKTAYDTDQQIEELKLDLIKKSGDKALTLDEFKEKKRLEIQIKYAKARLALIETDPARAKETELLKTQIAVYQSELSGIGKKKKKGLDNPINDLIKETLGVDDGQLGEIVGAFKSAYSQITAIIQASTQAQIAENDKVLDSLRTRIDATQSLLEQEQEKQAKGYANNVDAKKAELSALKKEEELKQKEQQELKKKALKQQIIIDTAQQASSIITMGAKAVSAYAEIPFAGIALAAAAITGFLGLLISLKARTQQLNSLAEGGPVTQFLNGKTDKNGQRGYIVIDENGNQRLRIGGDEFMMNNAASTKYRPILEQMNAGTFKISSLLAKESGHATRSNRDISDKQFALHMGEIMYNYMHADHNYWDNKPERIGTPDDYIEITKRSKKRVRKV